MRRALAIVALLATAGASPRLPGPATASYTRGPREAADAACVKCHATIATEHAGSLHARSFSDPSFQKGYAAEPKDFCRACHAPEAHPSQPPDTFARTKGVACVTCHQSDASGAVLASPGATASKAPHPVLRVADFGTRACASCHDFPFPGAEAKGERGRMQKTALEHAASRDSEKTCASCHMRGSHAFRGSRDAAFLAAALDVTSARTADGGAEFVLSSKDVGHAFPTGDLFRRLVLRVTSARGTMVERSFERTFGAELDPTTGKYVRFERSDTRLQPSRRIAFPLTGALGWEVAYQRVTGVGQTPPFTIDVEDEIVLAQGRLP